MKSVVVCIEAWDDGPVGGGHAHAAELWRARIAEAQKKGEPSDYFEFRLARAEENAAIVAKRQR